MERRSYRRPNLARGHVCHPLQQLVKALRVSLFGELQWEASSEVAEDLLSPVTQDESALSFSRQTTTNLTDDILHQLNTQPVQHAVVVWILEEHATLKCSSPSGPDALKFCGGHHVDWL